MCACRSPTRKSFNALRCAMVSPERNKTYELWTSDMTHSYSQMISIHGENMNTQCLRLLMVPQDQHCRPADIDDAVIASSKIMDEGGYPVLDHNDKAATFTGVTVFKEGIFKLCLVQLHQSPLDRTPRILGSAEIGQVIATKNWKKNPEEKKD